MNPNHDPKTGRFTFAGYYAAITGGDVNKIHAAEVRNQKIRAGIKRIERVKAANARSARIRGTK